MATRNIEINYKTDSGYDVLYPKGISTNIILEDGEILETTINDIQNVLNNYNANIGSIKVNINTLHYSGSGTRRPTSMTTGDYIDYDINLESTVLIYFDAVITGFGGDFTNSSQVTATLFDYNGGSTYSTILKNGGIVSYQRNSYSLRMGASFLGISKLRIGTTTAQTDINNWNASFTVKVYTFNLEG